MLKPSPRTSERYRPHQGHSTDQAGSRYHRLRLTDQQRLGAAGQETSSSFTVSWSGKDDAGGSGIASYSICVADNGGAFQPWLTDTKATSATYTAQYGHTYGFYSVATDNVGNREAAPTSADATTRVVITLHDHSGHQPTGWLGRRAVGDLYRYRHRPERHSHRLGDLQGRHTTLGTVPLNAKGVASFSTSALTGGQPYDHGPLRR